MERATNAGTTYCVNVVTPPVAVYAVLPNTNPEQRELLRTFTEAGQQYFTAQSGKTVLEGGTVGLVTETFRGAPAGNGNGGGAQPVTPTPQPLTPTTVLQNGGVYTLEPAEPADLSALTIAPNASAVLDISPAADNIPIVFPPAWVWGNGTFDESADPPVGIADLLGGVPLSKGVTVRVAVVDTPRGVLATVEHTQISLVPFVQPIMTSQTTWSNTPSCGWEVTQTSTIYARAQGWQALAAEDETAFYPYAAGYNSGGPTLTLVLEKPIRLRAIRARRPDGASPVGGNYFATSDATFTATRNGETIELGVLTVTSATAYRALTLPAPVWVDTIAMTVKGRNLVNPGSTNVSCIKDLQFIADISPL